ncbi:phage antirepressor protein [Candidatus Saccharibacteria bacterium CG_4_10_14_0_2_um_filter_52_9]|nr:MAG: phage antirepressor protein [Candidatus Saccharibacteria bacterium CG_4_10_14_0_2_um_filter_52_9]
MTDDETTKIALFRQREIRKVLHGGEWWFVIADVVAALTDSADPSQYLRRLRLRDVELAKIMETVDKGAVQIVPPLLLNVETSGGKQKLPCWHTEGIFRLIQSVPSPKAEPFKRWLAKVGYERIQEIENPELAAKRMKAVYRAKGYSDDWIEKRARGIAVREELTDEWQKRGVKAGQGYSILTAEISKAAFGVTPSQYKKLKGLKRENLRDHMTDLELIFTMLGEASTTEITRTDDAQGFDKNQDAARRGGGVAGKARKQLESETGGSIISKKNFLPKGGEQKGN